MRREGRGPRGVGGALGVCVGRVVRRPRRRIARLCCCVWRTHRRTHGRTCAARSAGSRQADRRMPWASAFPNRPRASADTRKSPTSAEALSPSGADVVNMITREPIGVVGAVLPWNFPALMLAWKIGPALSVGNSVIVKSPRNRRGTCAQNGRVQRCDGFRRGRGAGHRAASGCGSRRVYGIDRNRQALFALFGGYELEARGARMRRQESAIRAA